MGLFDAIVRRRLPPLAVDVALAMIILAGSLVTLGGKAPGEEELRPMDTWGVLLLLIAGVPMAFHRLRPVPVLTAMCVATLILQGGDYIYPMMGRWGGPAVGAPYMGLTIAVFLTVLRAPRATWFLLVLVTAVVVTEALLNRAYWVGTSAVLSLLLFGAWTVGTLFVARRLVGQEAVRRAAAVAREQTAVAREAVAHERTRIARELHDIVAHNVSLMVVQTIAADRMQERDHAKTHELHRTIEETGRATVAELRRLLDVLRTDDDGDPGSGQCPQPPQPTIAALPDLVESMRAAGLRVEYRASGTPVPLPAGTELAAYRVVQEAFTNTLKHAGPTESRLTVSWLEAPRRLNLRICDEGERRERELIADEGSRTTGHGLVGMAERIAAVGGILETGPRPGGGFCVHATIPLPAAAHEGTLDAADPCSAGR
ncbi:sensor histidine kinase [Actinomadura sp. NEAU-AAG7]|uniref:sensor histidine kinase n=1 Tax=Actinomadura sp. NEAU-AAG7 TaxID=2839640 RepID=UPI001BE4AB99|nr:histidine kinase [Actinomadura sp. NEAU-AAG7]MBT2207945.1 sensor histidine kinase [Actinomadura sp. NEAU-AAG7]